MLCFPTAFTGVSLYPNVSGCLDLQDPLHPPYIPSHSVRLNISTEIIQARSLKFGRVIQKKFSNGCMGTVFDSLNEIFKIVSKREDFSIKQGCMKKEGYFKRFFSDEPWEEWIHGKTPLGRVVNLHIDYATSSAPIKSFIKHLDIDTLDEAEYEARRLLRDIQDCDDEDGGGGLVKIDDSFELPKGLGTLLAYNQIGAEGAKGLQLPQNLQSLNLGQNQIGAEGVKGLQLPLDDSFELPEDGWDEGVNGFLEFVRQFRFIKKDEAFKPFLEQLQNFYLDGITSLKLVDKALSANETQAILQVLNRKMNIRSLDLGHNRIGNAAGRIAFPKNLVSLNLEFNQIGDKGAKELHLPQSLLSLNLDNNLIKDEGSKGLQLPQNLQSLSLLNNLIGDEGAKGLLLPQNLQVLYLIGNQIGAEGAKGLQLPQNLQSLNLGQNQIGAEGVKGLQLPLDDSFELPEDGWDEGVNGLQLPSSLYRLDFEEDGISEEGVETILKNMVHTVQKKSTGSKVADFVHELNTVSLEDHMQRIQEDFERTKRTWERIFG